MNILSSAFMDKCISENSWGCLRGLSVNKGVGLRNVTKGRCTEKTSMISCWSSVLLWLLIGRFILDFDPERLTSPTFIGEAEPGGFLLPGSAALYSHQNKPSHHRDVGGNAAASEEHQAGHPLSAASSSCLHQEVLFIGAFSSQRVHLPPKRHVE